MNAGPICRWCETPVQIRTVAGSSDQVALDAHPHAEGTWIVLADLTVTQPDRAALTQAYRIHTCRTV